MRALTLLVTAAALAGGCQQVPPPQGLSPAGLAPAPAPATVTVVQRRSEAVPGTGDRVQVEAGDITAGQVLVRVVDTETGADLLPLRSMRVGDSAEFAFAGTQHAVGVVRMVNFLIGDDFVELRVGPADAFPADQIEALLKRIEDSDRVFVRNGVDNDGPTAAAHLRQKWRAMAADVATAEEFIDDVATESSTSGDAYLVREGSQTRPLAAWLRGVSSGRSN